MLTLQVARISHQQLDQEQEEKTRPRTSRREEMVKIRLEINEIGKRETLEKIKATEDWFFEKINNIGKPFLGRTRQKREKIQITATRDRNADITNESTEIKTIMRPR